MGILAALVIGAIAGWLAGKIVHGAGFGLIGNIVVGIIGALVASWILPQLHIQLATGTVGAIVDATIGAVIVLVILSLIKRVSESLTEPGTAATRGRSHVATRATPGTTTNKDAR
ncbi:putative membrane protein YeaQ/YmgE (transglycosylase-associated protein family) [Bradyrhizobium sp. LM3.6]